MKKFLLLLLAALTLTASAEVDDNGARIQYVASASQTAFDYPFEITAEADLDVYVNDVLQSLTTNYTIAGEGEDDGGTVTFVSGRSNGDIVTLIRDTAIERTTNFGQNGPMTSANMNREFDKLFVIAQELENDFGRTLHLPATVEAVSDDFEIDPATYANKYLSFDADGVPTPADLTISGVITQEIVGQALWPRTAVEIAAGVTPSNYAYEPGDVRRYGGAPDDGASDTAAINTAMSMDVAVIIPNGLWLAQGLTQTLDFQTIYCVGDVRIQKNANGTLLTSTGDNVEFNSCQFRGGASGADYTGDGVIASGDNLRMINSGVRYISGVPLTATGNHVQIVGTNDIYQTTDASATGYDIVIGVSGTATLYHDITGIYTSQQTGGIRLIDTGSAKVSSSQFGKLWVDAGTSPVGTNGGIYQGNRILGAVEVESSSAVFAGDQFGAVNIHFVSGTSGHRLDESNVLQSDATIDDDSNNSYVIDTRIMSELLEQPYTPTWTASVNPAIGDGTLEGYSVKQGRRVFWYLHLLTGATTTYGTGNWTFSLPYAPIVKQIVSCEMVESGVNTEGGIAALASGAASMQVFPTEAPSNAVGPSVPFTWAGAGDEMWCSGEFYTDTP